MNVFVTSDQHWGHANVIRYSNRPFKNIGEHDAALVKAWNDVVGKSDIVYHLGDFTLGSAAFASYLFQQLNGTIRVLENPWHHDARWLKPFKKTSNSGVIFEMPIVVLEHIFKSGDEWLPVVLCHYPFEAWDRSHYGSVHLHGHTHGAMHCITNRLDVGVDVAYNLLGAYRSFYLQEAVDIAKNYSTDVVQ